MSNVRYKNWTHSERRSSQRPKETFSTSGSARQPPSRAPPCFSCQSSQHDLSCYCADVFSLFRYDFQMFPAFSADIRSNVFLSVIETRLRASNLILLDPDALCSFFHSIELIWFQQQTIRAELFPSLPSRDVNIPRCLCDLCLVFLPNHSSLCDFTVTRRSRASVSADI